jgi:hypothetical protein
MAERIDIIVAAAGGAAPIARGGGQTPTGGGGDAAGIARTGAAAKTAAGGIEGMAQSVQGLQAAFQGLAVVGIAQQLIGWGTGAAQASMQLDKVEGTARMLSGTTKSYNELLALAKTNQGLFGGSLADNIQGLTGFANMAKKSGVSLSEFNDLAQRLNLLDPAQGMEGAAVALKEAMSGSSQSLVERYELPRAALAKLSDANMSAADRVKYLSAMIADQGVAAGAGASGVTETAKAYNELGAQLDTVKTKVGGWLADFFAVTARGGTFVINVVKDGSGGGTETDTSATYVQPGMGYEDYQKNVVAGRQATNEKAGLIGNPVQIGLLGKAQFEYAQSLIATGTAANDAYSKSVALSDAFDAASVTAYQLGDTTGATEQRMIALAQSSDQGHAGVVALASALSNGRIGADQFALGLAGLETSQRAITDAANASASASAFAAQRAGERGDAEAAAARTAASASASDALAKATSAAQTDILKIKNDQLNAAIAQAAGSGATAQEAAVRLAGVYSGVSVPTLITLINLLREKAALEGVAVAGPPPRTGDAQDREDAAKASNYQYQLQQQITEATGSTAQKLALVNEQMRHAAPLSEAMRALEVKRASLLKQQSDERIGAAKTAASQASAAQSQAQSAAKAAASAAEAEMTARRDAQRRIEDQTQAHYDKLRSMQEDYALSSSRRTEDYERERQRLLAEGKIKEAQLLGEKFAIDSKRAAEDNARARAREDEQAGKQIAETAQQAGIKAGDRERKRDISGVALPGGAAPSAPSAAPLPPGAAGGGAAAPTAGAAGVRAAIQFNISIATTMTAPDGAVLARQVWPTIQQLVDEDLAGQIVNLTLTAAPGTGQGAGVGGPTP